MRELYQAYLPPQGKQKKPTIVKFSSSSWEEIVEGAANELEDWEQDYALAAIRRQILLATASDYL